MKKNNKKIKQNSEDNDEKIRNYSQQEDGENKKERKKIPIKKIYTLEELIISYKELEELETKMKNILMDINALKLKAYLNFGNIVTKMKCLFCLKENKKK